MPNKHAFPQTLATVKYNLGPISVTNVQLIILGVSIFLMLALQFIVQKLKWVKPCVPFQLTVMLRS